MEKRKLATVLRAIMIAAAGGPLVGCGCGERIDSEHDRFEVPVKADLCTWSAKHGSAIAGCSIPMERWRSMSCEQACEVLVSVHPVTPTKCLWSDRSLGGPWSVECEYEVARCSRAPSGRRPSGWRPNAKIASRTSILGCHFAALAELEDGSVYAFLELAEWLRGVGAPSSLIAATRRAADDERRHFTAMQTLAREHGVEVPRATVPRRAHADIEAIALDNEVEGCVRETFGALLATWVSLNARDPSVRSVMQSIARDETGHAALSWHLRSWLRPRVSLKHRLQLDDAFQRAIAELDSETGAWSMDRHLIAEGLAPSGSVMRGLLDAARLRLWSVSNTAWA